MDWTDKDQLLCELERRMRERILLHYTTHVDGSVLSIFEPKFNRRGACIVCVCVCVCECVCGERGGEG